MVETPTGRKLRLAAEVRESSRGAQLAALAAGREASIATRRRAADEKLAAQLQSRGWLLVAPEHAEDVRAAISRSDEWHQ